MGPMCSKPSESAEPVPNSDIKVKRNTQKNELPTSEAVDGQSVHKALGTKPLVNALESAIKNVDSTRWIPFENDNLPSDSEQATALAKAWCLKMNSIVYGVYEFLANSDPSETPAFKVTFKVAQCSKHSDLVA